MVTWQSRPQQQVIVTHGETPYTLKALTIVVRGHENGFDTGTVLLSDLKAVNYIDKVAAGDAIQIQQKDASDGSWTNLLTGVIRRVEPSLSNETGGVLNVECDGRGYGFGETKCAEEYGTESSNPTLDTIKEIIEDGSKGIIPLWVQKVLGDSEKDSGYVYVKAVETIAGSIPYVYFPYKPCDKAINDLCNIVQGIKGASAGPHWIVTPGARFCLATVGNHGAPASTYWPTWWRTNEAGSTLVEGEDFLNFRFQQLAKEANYVLYHGRFRKPPDGDRWWSEYKGAGVDSGKDLWDKHAATTLFNDNAIFRMNSYSIRGDAVSPNSPQFWYPSGKAATWDITKWGGENNIPTISFWIRTNNIDGNTYVYLYTGPGATDNYFRNMGHLTVDTWYHVVYQIGPFAHRGENATKWSLGAGAQDWADINWIEFHAFTVPAGTGKLWVDDVQFNGWILRGARQAAAYSATNPLKLKVITDEVAKDDSGKATVDTGLMGLLCRAEYLRCQSTPRVGTFTTRIAKDIMPGQKIHLHAKKQSSGDFRIDDDFRVTRPIHSINNQGFHTIWDVTDDMTNANPRPMPTQLNTFLTAVRPEYQDRQASSIKTREIDITQDILEKTY